MFAFCCHCYFRFFVSCGLTQALTCCRKRGAKSGRWRQSGAVLLFGAGTGETSEQLLPVTRMWFCYFVLPTPCDVWGNPCIPGEGLRLPEQPVVVGMPTDPEPDYIALVFHGHGAVMEADTDRPEASNRLAMQRSR